MEEEVHGGHREPAAVDALLEYELARVLGVLNVLVHVLPRPVRRVRAHLLELPVRPRENTPALEVHPLELPAPRLPEVHLGAVADAPPPALDPYAGPAGLHLLPVGLEVALVVVEELLGDLRGGLDGVGGVDEGGAVVLEVRGGGGCEELVEEHGRRSFD